MNKIKIAIVGATGTTYKRTIPALKNSQICEVVAVQGRNLEKLKRLQKEFKIKEIYSTVDELLTTAVYDCIYIGTPPFLHFDNVKAAALTLKPIICEKPLTIDYKSAKKISTLLNKYDENKFMIAHHLRHQKAIHDIKMLIENDTIGEVINVYMQWGFEMNLEAPSAKWKTNPTLGGKGTFSDNGIHIIDLAIFLFGLPEWVVGKADSIRTLETYDSETALLIYKKMNVLLQSSQCMKHPGNHILIYGTKGNIQIYNGIGERCIRKISIVSDKCTKIIEYPESNLYSNEVENFCKNLITKNFKHHGTNLKEGLSALKIIDLIRDSASTNSSIRNYNE